MATNATNGTKNIGTVSGTDPGIDNALGKMEEQQNRLTIKTIETNMRVSEINQLAAIARSIRPQ